MRILLLALACLSLAACDVEPLDVTNLTQAEGVKYASSSIYTVPGSKQRLELSNSAIDIRKAQVGAHSYAIVTKSQFSKNDILGIKGVDIGGEVVPAVRRATGCRILGAPGRNVKLHSSDILTLPLACPK